MAPLVVVERHLGRITETSKDPVCWVARKTVVVVVCRENPGHFPSITSRVAGYDGATDAPLEVSEPQPGLKLPAQILSTQCCILAPL